MSPHARKKGRVTQSRSIRKWSLSIKKNMASWIWVQIQGKNDSMVKPFENESNSGA